MLKEQLGQLYTSATFALKAVNAAQSVKNKIASSNSLLCSRKSVARMLLTLKEFSSKSAETNQSLSFPPPRPLFGTHFPSR